MKRRRRTQGPKRRHTVGHRSYEQKGEEWLEETTEAQAERLAPVAGTKVYKADFQEVDVVDRIHLTVIKKPTKLKKGPSTHCLGMG